MTPAEAKLLRQESAAGSVDMILDARHASESPLGLYQSHIQQKKLPSVIDAIEGVDPKERQKVTRVRRFVCPGTHTGPTSGQIYHPL